MSMMDLSAGTSFARSVKYGVKPSQADRSIGALPSRLISRRDLRFFDLAVSSVATDRRSRFVLETASRAIMAAPAAGCAARRRIPESG